MTTQGPSINADHYAVERLYRAVADREPTLEILQLIYDLYGTKCGLRPPVAELRLATHCAAGGGLKHG